MNYSRFIQKIIFAENLRKQLMAKALNNRGVEVAGILLGEIKNNIGYCRSILYGNKDGWKRDSFQINDLKLIKLISNNDLKSSKVIAIFHAHPSGDLFPSFEDIKVMILTGVPWLIFTVNRNNLSMKAFLFEEEVIRKIKISKQSY